MELSRSTPLIPTVIHAPVLTVRTHAIMAPLMMPRRDGVSRREVSSCREPGKKGPNPTLDTWWRIGQEGQKPEMILWLEALSSPDSGSTTRDGNSPPVSRLTRVGLPSCLTASPFRVPSRFRVRSPGPFTRASPSFAASQRRWEWAPAGASGSCDAVRNAG